MKKVIKGVLIIIVSFAIGIWIVESQENNRAEQHQQLMCARADARLISSGMMDCDDGK